MSRIILLLELVFGALALSIYFGGGDIFSLIALSPFMLIALFPAAAAFAVWPPKQVITAFRNAYSSASLLKPDPVSEKIIFFCTKISYIGAVIGLVIGTIILFVNLPILSFSSLQNIIKHSLAGITAALAAAIILKQMSGIFTRKHKIFFEMQNTQQDALKQLCERYGITVREKEIIKMIARGSSNREICRELDITHDTVKNHVYNIFKKTGVKNRNGLVGLLLGIKTADNK